MKISNLLRYLAIGFLGIQLVSCDNKGEIEPAFETTPAERILSQKKELNQVLESSEMGWKTIYFTDTTQLGGFTHLFQFKNGKVKMASDFDEDTTVHESEYSIDLGSTVSLVFTTKNKIHLLSDSNNAPNDALDGQGYKGDFQFLYYGKDKEDIVFKTNRSFKELRFVKATALDWQNIAKNREMMENMKGSNRPLYRSLETFDGTKKTVFNFNYSTATRFARADALNSTSKFGYNLGIGFTPNGIVMSPGVTIGNQKLNEFIYDATTGNFNATGTAGVTAAIKYSNTPLVLSDDYKSVVLGQPRSSFAYFDNDAIVGSPDNSALFFEELDKVNASLPNGLYILRVTLNFNIPAPNNTVTHSIQYLFSNNTTLHHYVTTAADVNSKTIQLTHQSWTAGTPLYYQTILGNFDAFLRDPKGIYVKKEDYKIKYSNVVYTFSAASNPFRMASWKL